MSRAATAYQHRLRDWESKAEKLRHKTYTLRAVSFHERVKYREINRAGKNARARGECV